MPRFEFYSAPAIEDDKVFLVHFAELEPALDYFRTIDETVGRMPQRIPQNRHGRYFPRQGLEGQIMNVNGKTVNEKALARRVKDHVLGSVHEFFAVVQPGFEATAREELRELGIASPRIAGSGGVAFNGKLEDAWRANLGAGTVSRVLMRLDEFKATGFGEFRAKLAGFAWELHLADQCPGRVFHPGGPFAAVARRQAGRGSGAGDHGAPGRVRPPGSVH